MTLYRSLNRALRQRHGSLTSAYRSNGVVFDSVLRSSCRTIGEICQKGNAFQIAVVGGSRHLDCSNSCGHGRSSYSLDLWTKDRIFSASFKPVQFKSAYIANVQDHKPLAIAGMQRRFIHGGPALWSLIAVNVGVFAMWYRLDTRFMMKHFLLSMPNMMSGGQHNVLTSAFSHTKMDHLLWNMLGLFCFGGAIERLYGGLILLGLYAGGAVSGSFGHLFYFRRVYPWLKRIPIKSYDVMQTPAALGASGAVTGLTILFILNYPTHTIFLMFFPMPAAIAGCVIIGRDVYLALKGDSNISVGGHLGGALYGAVVYAITRLVSL